MGLFDAIFKALEGWSRKREERDRAFVAANTGWSSAAVPSAPPGTKRAGAAVDREGLQAAFLDHSGRIAYYLDATTGDVVESATAMTAPRYLRVPSRPVSADADERLGFIAALDASPLRDRLSAAKDSVEFRRVLSADRTLERKWFVYRNDRASEAVEQWLRANGLG